MTTHITPTTRSAPESTNIQVSFFTLENRKYVTHTPDNDDQQRIMVKETVPERYVAFKTYSTEWSRKVLLQRT